MTSNIQTGSTSRRKRALVGGAIVAAVSALSLGMGATAANAATFTSGHTDIVSVSCNASGVLTIDTFREDVGHISPANIGDQSFVYDDSDAPASGVTFASNVWTVSGDETFEDDIPFIGFQYASAASAAFCPSSVSFDVSKVSGSTNTGDATFTGNSSLTGSTSSAAGDTSKVTVWRPGSGLGPSHEHGIWTFGGPSTGGDYTLQFQTYRGTSTTPVATVISPVHIHVQP